MSYCGQNNSSTRNSLSTRVITAVSVCAEIERGPQQLTVRVLHLVVTGRNCYPYDSMIHIVTHLGTEENHQIYDAAGRPVRTIRNLRHCSVIWNGCDDSNQKARAGVYFCVLLDAQAQTLGQTKITKLP